MNRKQVAYQIGRAVYNNYDVMFLAMAAKCGYDSVDHFMNSQIPMGIFNGAMSLFTGFLGLTGIAARGVSYLELKKIKTDRDQYPLEHSERVIIDDSDGLELLLSKTHDGESKEWGTLLKAHDDKGRAVVDDVLDIPLGKELGLIGEGTQNFMSLEILRADGEGYKGYQHYHPDVGPRWFGARNFSVGLNDRFKPEDWINLLTFNLPEGPEIVGFNRQHTYIPTDTSRKELVRATPRQIMKYLRA
jgi:hypothetical protein